MKVYNQVICEHNIKGICKRKDAHLCAYHSNGKCSNIGSVSRGHWPEHINHGDK